ncbi:MAG: winged helix-turn-helix domain-containing protein [Xanthomonadales bacterium]|nr:winged helix-turn-helix domain-containing protein [Xanthomonadales bacterium]
MPTSRPESLRFAEFTLDLRPARLRKAGVNVALQAQPLRLLTLLASQAGQLVTHRQIQQHVWGDLQVDFASGMHVCIRQIRKALEDDGVEPRFIETVPRRGYRFIAPVATVAPAQAAAEKRVSRKAPIGSLVAAAVIPVAALLWLNLRSEAPAHSPEPIASEQALNPEDAFSEGLRLLRSGSEVDARRSRPYFESVIASDPAFAPAHAALAKAFAIEREFGPARQHAEQAIAIDPTYAEARLRLAALQGQAERDWSGAEENIARALEIAPDQPDAHRALASLYAVTGRFEQALSAIERAQRLLPDSVEIAVEHGQLLYYAGDYERARLHCQQAATAGGGDRSAQSCLYKVALIQQDLESAQQAALALMTLAEASPDQQAAVAKPAARRALDNFESWRVEQSEDGETGADPLLLAYSMAALRQYDEAFYYLRKAVAQHRPGVALATFDPIFIPIRHQSQYLAMLAELGVVYVD